MTQEAGGGDAGMDRVHEAIHAGRKIEAIKVYREIRGVGLKEAKEAVERLIASDPDAYGSGRASGGSGHGAVKASSGCGSVVLVGLGGLLFVLLM